MNEADRYSLEGLRNIHREMDDDQDGGIEVEESVEFIIEDMKQQPTNKHSRLHREDQHITIEELWRGWKFSEVHNWTQDEVLRWLREFVELPQYEKNFKDFRVNGNTLPRIAANEPSFLSGQLKIVDQRDKQKLNIKALDAVLFGAPIRPPHNYMKDLLLIVSVMMGVGGCWFSQVQNKASKVHISKMMKDLESLQNAELSLRELQEQLEQAQEEKRNVTEEKQNLEEKMRDEIMGAQEEAHRLHRLRAGAVSQLSRLRYAEEELEQVRGALKKAEKDMMAYWSVPEALQLWLQLTHEVEVQYYNIKKHSAELQLNTAKEEAEKIKKKRSSLMGTFHVAHSSSLDDVDTKILEAKNALSEVTACLRERLHRWQQIERLCGFPLLRNSGLASLTATLYSDSNWVAMFSINSPILSPEFVPHFSEIYKKSYGECSLPFATLVPPMKRSPRSRGSTSTVCRQRRSGHASSSSSSSSYSDPDILIPIHTTLPCFEEEEQIFINAQEEMVAAVGTPTRRISREEEDFLADSAQRRMAMARDKLTLHLDCNSSHKMLRKKMEFSVEPPSAATRKISIDEHHEMCSHTSRRTNSDKIDRSIDTPTGKIYPDRVDSTPEILKRRISREEYAGSSQLGHDPQVLDWGQFGQPDLTLSTPWKQTQTPDPYTPDLTELVYDGILEKSCITPATTPDLPQRITEGREREGNPPVPPPRSCRSLNTLPPEMRGERHQKDKDKSTKSSKLKSLFKKRKDHTPELPQGGLNNL
uniref:SAM domain-containing protein n=1 Tax=Oncorhynchus kisutch TaxID=8019 RepID=A0A8C7LCN6_ONCKI